MDRQATLKPSPERYADFEAALDVAAHLVQHYGVAYLPFYAKLEKSLENLRSEELILQRVTERVGKPAGEVWPVV